MGDVGSSPVDATRSRGAVSAARRGERDDPLSTPGHGRRQGIRAATQVSNVITMQ